MDNKNKNPNVPNLRFNFEDDYTTYQLHQFASRVTRKNKNNESLLPLTISAQYGLVDQISFFNKSVASSDLSNYYLLQNGEFAYNKSYSNDYPWGAIKRLDRYDKGCLSTLYICFKPNESLVDTDYLVHYFESPKWYKQVSDIAGEGARNHGLLNIAVRDFFLTKHKFPSLEEQGKVADLLNKIQERIEAQNKIIEDLVYQKNQIRKKIVNKLLIKSEVRLCNLCSIVTGKKDANQMRENGQYKFFTCSKDDYYIDTYSFEGESLIISGNGEIGLIKFYSGKFDAYQRTYVLQNFLCDPIFLKSVLEEKLPRVVNKEKNIGAMPYITIGTLNNILIPLPNDNAQLKVKEIIQKLELRIKNESQILIDFEIQKKYLLNNLFI